MSSNVDLQLDGLASRQTTLLEETDPKRESGLLDFYVRIIPRVLNAERCRLFILDRENRNLWLKAETATERAMELPMEASIVGDVISSGKPVIASHFGLQSDTHRKIEAETGFVTREIICVPFRSKDGGEISGAIEVINKNTGAGFGKEDQEFLEEIGEHLRDIVDRIFPNHGAVDMGKGPLTMVIVGTALGAGFFVLSLIAMAVLSRLE